MKTISLMLRTLTMAAAMFGFASGAWAQDAGDDAASGGDEVLEAGTDDGVTDDSAGGGDEIFQTGVVDAGEAVDDQGTGEEVADGNGTGEEVIYYMTGAGGEEVADGEAVTEPGEAIVDGAGVVTGYTDADGNVVFFRSDSVDNNGSDEQIMYTLASQSGAAGSFMSVSDSTAEQGGIDSGMGNGIEVLDAGQAGFGPIDVQGTAAVSIAGGAAGGTATHISGGHLTGSSKQ